MRIIIETADELLEKYEELAQKSRDSIGKTRTKLESNEMKGQVAAFNEAIFYLKEYIKTQKEMKNGTASKVESVDNDPSAALSGIATDDLVLRSEKVKA